MVDPLSILSRTEAYEAINDMQSANAGASDRDMELFLWIGAVSRRIDQLCGPVVAREKVEKHSGGAARLRLRTVPVLSVTSVADATETVDAETYELVDDNRFVPYLLHNALWPSGTRNLTVTYQAGRAADTDAVDPLFKLAAANVLVGLWTKYGGAWARGGDPFTEGGQPQFFDELTHNVKRWLADELLPPAVA